MTAPADKKPAAPKAPRSRTATAKPAEAKVAAKAPRAAKAAAKAVAKPAAAKPAAAKAATPRVAKPKPTAPAPAVPVLEVVTEAVEDAAAVAVTRLKELVAKVAEVTDTKKAKVRAVVEAFLTEVGSHLEKGDALHLPGLGRMHVAKTRPQGTGSMMQVKLKRAGAKPAKNTGAEPLAEDGEDS
ncbi:HU family DNA-binding protein [Fuscibacter oryzae]|uniref:HU family DNA-binding protein n=1 Tax=Fuscibacter oryzae TaxID=2803939 RepID=A0A8J7SVZ9_9RHOB|nr:HU family DNA-binding protein [Fuscibacter oryzae]MBL4930047.1 HU family DNA-binding protein [Fuscibacter oryzae]